MKKVFVFLFMISLTGCMAAAKKSQKLLDYEKIETELNKLIVHHNDDCVGMGDHLYRLKRAVDEELKKLK